MRFVDVQRNRAAQRMIQDIGAVPEREWRADRIDAKRRTSHFAEPGREITGTSRWRK